MAGIAGLIQTPRQQVDKGCSKGAGNAADHG